MKITLKKHSITSMVLAALLIFSVSSAFAAKVKLRLSASASPTDERAVAMNRIFGPMVSKFADFEPSYNATLFKQGTELEAISRGNLEMTIASAQEFAQYIPEFSIFATGYVHQSADHQIKVFNAPLMDYFKEKAEDELGIKLLTVMYLGQRQVNLRMPKSELNVRTPDDLSGVKLRMPGTDAWLFLGKALGASPVPVPFTEVYTALQTGAVDGQDNPLPTMVDKKFYEVTKQVVLTSHLVDLNYIVISKKVWDKFSRTQQRVVQRAAESASKSQRGIQLKKEKDLVSFIKGQGLDVYEPDLNAFRKHVQAQYVDSEFAASWPKGVLEKINALGK